MSPAPSKSAPTPLGNGAIAGAERPSVGPGRVPVRGYVDLQYRPTRFATPVARRRVMRRWRRLARTVSMATLLVFAIVWLTSQGSGIAPVPGQLRLSSAKEITLGGAAGVRTSSVSALLPWPRSGQAAVEVPALGYRAQSGVERAAPVASLTKIMTAYVVLRDHPLALGQAGPRITVTAADAADFGTDTVTDQASVEITRGEVLSEYQMLEGLLVHSANDLAFSLACWDAGSVASFVVKMNAAAAALGMDASHFTDASGLDPSSESTSADLLKVTAAAMADPVFAQIVQMPSVTLPVAGTVQSYTPLEGTPDVVGVKSGFTDTAGGGDVLAYRATVDGRPLLVLAAVTGQEGPTVLEAAGKEALALAQAIAAQVRETTVARAGHVVARLDAGRGQVGVALSSGASVLYLPGSAARQVVHVHVPAGGARPGAVVGTVTYELGAERVSVPVRATSAVQ